MSGSVLEAGDRETLDREYDNSAKVPNASVVIARFTRESEATRRALPCVLDVRYGAHERETLDIFPAGGPGLAPVQIFIHGGYWRALGKSDVSYVARAFHPAGVAVVVIDYALIPSVDMDELVRQCRAAAAWTYRHARSFGGDPARIYVSGHSAGGHLAAMLLATDWASFDGLPTDALKGGCGISGLYDLEPIRRCFLNDDLKLDPEQTRRNSPVHLAPSAAGPVLLAVGEREGREYHRQTDALATAWGRRGLPCEILDLAGHDHFSIAMQLDDPASDLTRAIMRRMTVR